MMVPTWAPALGACALVVLAGAGWLSLFRIPSARGTAWFGLAFALGVSWLAIATTALSATGAWANLIGICAALALPLGLTGWKHRRTFISQVRNTEPAAAMRDWLSFTPALCVVVLAFWFSCQRPVWNIDAQKRWVLHGQWISQYHTVLPETVGDAAWTTTYPTYPPLVPALVGFALELGADRDMGVRPLFPIIFFALLACIHGYASRVAGRRLASIITLGFALTPCFAYLDRFEETLGLGADAAMADIALATLLTAGSTLVLDMLRDPNRGTVAASCAVFGGAALTKQEGSVSALAIVALLAVWGMWFGEREKRRDTLRACSLCGISIVIVAAAWMYLSRNMPVEVGNDYVNASAPAAFLQHLERLPTVLGRLGSEFVRWSAWGPLWIVALAGVAWSIASYVKERRAINLLPALTGVWMLSGIALAIGSYLSTGWKGGNYTVLMEVSLTRILMHHAPLAAIIVCQLAFRKDLVRGGSTCTDSSMAL
jgi:hypothetical protein